MAHVARLTTFQHAPEHYDEQVKRAWEQTVPALTGQPGFLGAYWLADPKSGKAVVLTLWESEAAMGASEEAVRPLRSQTEEATGSQLMSLERFEVIGQA
jgi:heme-degrading monooxygenase HmoA